MPVRPKPILLGNVGVMLCEFVHVAYSAHIYLCVLVDAVHGIMQ